MAANMRRVPWEGARNFHEAVQSLWLTHMLVMSDEKYPGPGVSFGRLDQYLYPYYQKSLEEGMTHEEMKDILGCFWVHCNTAYDAQIRVGGNQGITAGFGQLFNLSGLGPDGEDMTNELTYLLLEVIDDMSPILEPKPNIRLHRKSPEKLLDKIVDMVSRSQGAPFLLNFDERSVAGMLLQARRSGQEDLIHEGNVHDYAAVGCLENTMAGNDRSGTVDNNINLLKALELVYANGSDLLPYKDPMTGKWSKIKQEGPRTGSLDQLDSWETFFDAYVQQTRFIVQKMVDTYELSESIRADFNPTPYLSVLVKGCAEKGLDVTQGGAELSYTTMEGVTFATTVDSLLAVKYLVYDQKLCSLQELVQALKDNWQGHEILQAQALHRAPKYGRDDPQSDALAKEVMVLWADEVWKHKTRSTGRQFRPGMLSWNYWIGAGYIMKASANGRTENQFLSNAICPSNGADLLGPTA
ncbi:MAG TPA: pyruvate formate lyase family protein, partial [Clostridia bacterium]|nr:pyruvate formate lyase family protein [Clostridia bacterium]